MGDDKLPDLPEDPDQKLKEQSEKLIAELALLIERAKAITAEHKQLVEDARERRKLPRNKKPA